MSEIKTESIWLKSDYQEQPLAVYVVSCPSVTPHAILQVTHGMAEYWMRYEGFAAFMAQHGYVVCGNDHLGHGATSGSEYPDGFFAPKNGREYVVQDVHQVTEYIRTRYPALPLILFGHSMGSFIVRWATERWPNAQCAAIYCGTGGKNPAAGAGLLLTSAISALRGPQYVSRFVENLAFGSYQKRIETPKTSVDWLSVDEENVQKYVADPKCGFPFTVSAFHELMAMVQHVNTDEWAQHIPQNLPVLVVAGREDPVGDYGNGPQEVARRLQDAGVRRVTLKLYDGMRHEILNETARQTVWNDLLAWCEQTLADIRS